MTDGYRGDERRRLSLNGLPGWAQVISVLGFPIVVALILLGMLTGVVPSPITRTQILIEQHMIGDGDRTRILRTMCRHQAVSLKQDLDDCYR